MSFAVLHGSCFDSLIGEDFSAGNIVPFRYFTRTALKTLVWENLFF